MIIECGFCHKVPNLISHANGDIFDIYLCEGCQRPDFNTRFRQLYWTGQKQLLAVTIRLDEFFLVLNYAFNFTSKRINYTTIYKKVIGEFNDSLDLEPITWGPDVPVFDLDFVVQLPLHDLALAKQKLQIYTTFS
jgi:hypothetical protein